jgi:site-specific recombinase XerC
MANPTPIFSKFSSSFFWQRADPDQIHANAAQDVAHPAGDNGLPKTVVDSDISQHWQTIVSHDGLLVKDRIVEV